MWLVWQIVVKWDFLSHFATLCDVVKLRNQFLIKILTLLQHTNDFPLYTEAIKFFNHSESMVRIAVRTLSLNVYKVEDESMLRFVIDKTAVPYFANLVWFIGNHILEIDACVRNDAE